MIELEKSSLLGITPDNLASDANIQAICKSLDVPLQEVAKNISMCLILPNIDTLPENIIDLLAWQYHVDFYDYSLPIDKKRQLVKTSFEVHRHKGTPYAVKTVVSAIISDAKVSEWFEYGGRPYYFKVTGIESPMPDDTIINSLVRAIYTAKNERSWLEGVEFLRNITSKFYIGITQEVTKTVTVGLPKITAPETTGEMYVAGAFYIHKEVTVNHG